MGKEKRDEVYSRGKTGEEKKGRHIRKRRSTHHHSKQTHNVIISQG